METLSEKSCEAYRAMVRGDPRFVPYFRSATPELELGHLKIGSRPAKRKASGGVESLRAIPWIFAWTVRKSVESYDNMIMFFCWSKTTFKS
jgi:phosphoenolpyruvate carboxylase